MLWWKGAPAPKRVLVYGDSLSWGWVPQATFIPAERFPPEGQWSRVMAVALGDGFEVVIDALPGRVTDRGDPLVPQLGGAGLDGLAYLPAALGAHAPLDLVVLMLGSNDLKPQFFRSAFRIALGVGRLIDAIQHAGHMSGTLWTAYPAPAVLLVCPPPLDRLCREAGDFFAGWEERAQGMQEAYRHVAAAAGVAFFDAGTVVHCDGKDGVHMTAESQRRLGEAMALQVRAVLGNVEQGTGSPEG